MLKNVKIGIRLGLGFTIILVFMLAVGGYAFLKIESLHNKIETVVDVNMVNTSEANKIIDNINRIARALRNLLIDEKRLYWPEELKAIEDGRNNIGEAINKLDKGLVDKESRAQLKEVVDIRTPYIATYQSFIDMVKNEEIEKARVFIYGDLRKIQRDYLKKVADLINQQTKLAEEAGRKAAIEASNTKVFIGSLLILAVTMSLLLAILIIRSITTPVSKASAVAEIMAQGDFTSKLDIRQNDEIGVMARSLNTMREQLGNLIGEVVGSVNRLTSSSNGLAAISTQLTTSARDTSDRANMVASAAEEMATNIQSVSASMEQSSTNVHMVASSIEEMTATVNEIAESTERARIISEDAVKQSHRTSEKMANLGESANRIGRVTETITEISEQTNLLALNATIEAARAGDAGKGFAVVANEIKELARQTADATVDIKNQIEEMQETTAATVVDMGRISSIITEINDVIRGIASAVEEQSATSSEISSNISQTSQGIADVNQNVSQSTVVISDISRDVAGISQQSSQVENGSNQLQTSAQELAGLADQLNELMRKFIIQPG